MKKWMYILLLLTVVLSGCSSQATKQKSDIKGIEDISLKQLSRHKNTYLGDNSAIHEILSGLPRGMIREFEIVDGKTLDFTFKRQYLEKNLPHSFKEYKDDGTLCQKETVDERVKLKDKHINPCIKCFPIERSARSKNFKIS